MRLLLAVSIVVLVLCLPVLAVSAVTASVALLHLSGALSPAVFVEPPDAAAYPAPAGTLALGLPVQSTSDPLSPPQEDSTARLTSRALSTATSTPVMLPTRRPTSVSLPTAVRTATSVTLPTAVRTATSVMLPTQEPYPAWACGCQPYPSP